MLQSLFSRTGLLLLALITVVVLALINTTLKGARFDLTEDSLFTVSAGTGKMLKSMEKPVALEFYFSASSTGDVPQLRDFARRVRELLEEMVLKSGGQLSLTVIDPEPFSEQEDRAAELGLRSTPLSLGGPEIYLGLAASNEQGNTDAIAFLQPDREQLLEYDVAKMVYVLGRGKAPKAAMFSSLDLAGGFDMQTRQPKPAWMAFQQLQQMFDISTLGAGFDRINDDIDVLLLIHPAGLDDASLYAIDQFALRGGNIIAFVDPNAEQVGGANPMMPNPEAGPRSSDLPRLFKAWGFELQADKVLGDARYALEIRAPNGAPLRHLAILGFDSTAMVSEDIISANLDSLNFASAGVLQAVENASTRFTPIIQSSDKAMLLEADKLDALLDPRSLFQGFVPDGQRHTVAARIVGPANSAFPEGAPSVEQDSAANSETTAASASESETPAAEAEAALPEHIAASTQDINIIAVADSDVLSDRLWVQVQNFFGQRIGSAFADNGNFISNAVDNMIGNSDLISVRGRGEYTRRFTRVDEIRRDAETNYRNEEQALQQSLSETETKLRELQAQKDGEDAQVLALSTEQLAEVEKFEQEKLRIRKQLREVRHQLGKDIKALGTQMKLINIVLIPLLLCLVAFVFRKKIR